MKHWLTFVLLLALASPLAAQTSIISYQGRLDQNSAPYTGTADLEFRLFNAAAVGTQIGTTQTRDDWPVENGLFQVQLDFGSDAFSGASRWLEIRVNGTALSPRQRVTSAPSAVSAVRPWRVLASGNMFYDDGRVGIGTVLARQQLSVGSGLDLYSGTSNNPTVPSIRGRSSTSNLTLNAADDGAVFINHDGGSGGVRFHNGASGSANELMRLTGGGRLGIGTSNPNTALHVNGITTTGALISQGGISTLSLSASGNITGNGQLEINSPANTNALRVRVGGDTRLIVDSDGAEVQGYVDVHQTLFVRQILSQYNIEACFSPFSGGGRFLGRCGGSSKYLKENITPLHDASDLVAKLRPVKFTWIENSRPDIGLIAEEVAEVIPELVTFGDAGEIEGLNYRHLTAVLVGALQEQQMEIAALRTELEQQQRETVARLAALENLLPDGAQLAGRKPQ